jgi:PAS domain-containing protein
MTVFLASIAFLIFGGSRLLRADMEKMLGDQQLATVRLAAAEINANFKERADALTMIAAKIDASLIDHPLALQRHLENQPLLHMLFNAGIVVTRRDGVAISEYPKIGRVGVNYMDRDHIAAALQEGKATVSKPIIGKVVKGPSFALTAPILDEHGVVIGALVGASDLSKPNFLDSIIDSSYGKSGGYLLVDPKSRVFVMATANNIRLVMQSIPATGVNAVLDQRLLGFDGTTIHVTSQGIEVLTSSARIPFAGWLLISTIPTQEAFAPVARLEQQYVISALVFAMMAMILTWWLLRRVLGPMQSAAKFARVLADSGVTNSPLPIFSNDEVGDFLEGINRVMAVSNARERALFAGEYRLQTIIDSMADGLITQDSDGQIALANAAAVRILGLSREQLKGVAPIDTGWGFVHEDGAPYPPDRAPGDAGFTTFRRRSRQDHGG